MRKRLWAVGLLVVLIGVVGLAQTKLNVTARVIATETGAVYLFDNNTSRAQTTFVLAISTAFTLKVSDVIAFGGGEVKAVRNWGGGLAAVDIAVAAGGTLQITLVGPKAASAITFAWFSLT
ncbi:MAG: hypothetical protein NT125_07680 [Candidatus Bipolaricaulota bacterium]|nr:hypothetical protein [Candidatus Bipolaricaulota bacterium]